jgi:hypothetical protein
LPGPQGIRGNVGHPSPKDHPHERYDVAIDGLTSRLEELTNIIASLQARE